MKKTLVVARYKENVDWVQLWADLGWHVNIVEKEGPQGIGNWGRESGSYLHFIVKNYGELSGLYSFCQGDPYAHSSRFAPMIINPGFYAGFCKCDIFGLPDHWEKLDIPGAWKSLFGVYEDEDSARPPEELYFSPGAQFLVHAGKLKSRPYSFWERILNFCKDDPQAPWIMERLWPSII